jgi:hypothetical protein
MGRIVIALLFLQAGLRADEGIGVARQVSCSNPSSLEDTFRVPAPGGFYSAGWTEARRPVIARVLNGKVLWCKADLDLSGQSQVRGMIVHNGALYAAFSTPAQPSSPLTNWTADGWLRTPGRGGKMVSAILRLNANTGTVERGTFLTASADDGTAGGFQLKSLNADGNDLRITALADWQPRMKNRIPMTCTGKGPFLTTTILRSDLGSAVDAKAERCVCCE